MARLIDVEEVINIAKNTYTEEDVLKIAWLLCHTPTAYDVEKVVEGLEKAESVKLYGSRNSGNYMIPLKDAIEIVRRGGVK